MPGAVGYLLLVNGPGPYPGCAEQIGLSEPGKPPDDKDRLLKTDSAVLVHIRI